MVMMKGFRWFLEQEKKVFFFAFGKKKVFWLDFSKLTSSGEKISCKGWFSLVTFLQKMLVTV